jgi:hypothetical protein
MRLIDFHPDYCDRKQKEMTIRARCSEFIEIIFGLGILSNDNLKMRTNQMLYALMWIIMCSTQWYTHRELSDEIIRYVLKEIVVDRDFKNLYLPGVLLHIAPFIKNVRGQSEVNAILLKYTPPREIWNNMYREKLNKYVQRIE